MQPIDNQLYLDLGRHKEQLQTSCNRLTLKFVYPSVIILDTPHVTSKYVINTQYVFIPK